MMFEFQQAGAAFLTDGGVLLADEPGCVSGDAVLKVHRFGATRTRTLRELHAAFRRRPDAHWNVRALKGDLFGQHAVVDVVSKGVRPVIKVTLDDGKHLTITRDHEVLTDHGFVEATFLDVDDMVVVNGMVVCTRCGRKFHKKPSHAQKSNTHYCSRECTQGLRVPRDPVACDQCGAMVLKYPSSLKKSKGRIFCSRACRHAYFVGEQSPTWKGGRWVDKDGYVQVAVPEGHPERDAHGMAREHRLLAAKMIGRPLLHEEQVHHVNGIKDDNRPENLRVLSMLQHRREHHVESMRNLDGGRTINGGMVVTVPKLAKVVSVEHAGEVDVYDVVMADPHRNFVANGIVVHNCGKTKQVLDAAKIMQASTVLVVCPAIAVGVWKSEAAKWRPDLTALTVHEAVKLGRIPKKDRLLIVSYDHLVATRAIRERIGSINHDLLVLDEAHQLKNPAAKRTMLIYGAGCAGGPGSLVGRCGGTRLLTGTPVLNHNGELFPHLRCLAPERLEQRSYAGFVEHYCVKGFRKVRDRKGREHTIETIEGSNRETTPELARRMRGFWLKRHVKDVLPDLPPLRVEVRRLDPSMLDGTVLAEVEQSDEAKALRRAVEHGDADNLRHVEGHMARLRRLLALAKVDASVAWALGAIDAGEPKVAVWGWHVEALKRVFAGLSDLDPIMITGETGGRDKLVDRFQNDQTCRGGVFQIQAAGTALTMTACRRYVGLEQAWTPALNGQSILRHHRIGSTNAVLAEILVAPGIDEAVGGVLARKLADIQAIEEDDAA